MGVDDELTLVCKEILTLVESNRYRFEEIGVVGRTLVPYQSSLARIFDQHRIPFVSSAALPLLQEPVVKTLLQLAQLKSMGCISHDVGGVDVPVEPSFDGRWRQPCASSRSVAAGGAGVGYHAG